MVFSGIDPAVKRPSVIAVLREKGARLAMDGLFWLRTRAELLRILENKGIKGLAVDCPLYLPHEGEKWRREERELWERKMGCFSPAGGYMLALQGSVRELLGLEEKPGARGFVPGLGGKCRVYEAYPYASFTLLARAGDRGPLAGKRTPEGQAQRLALLVEYVDDLGNDIWQRLDHDALDAVAAALTHCFIETGKARRLGKCLWIPEI
jgi:predicted nuclease with RNAse H fold